MSIYEFDEKQIRRAMDVASRAGATFLLPLCAAALRGKLNLVMLAPGAAWPGRELRNQTKPTLILIGDDCELTWQGPTAWPQELRNWSRHAMIHGAAGTPDSYQMAVSRCMKAGRYVLVETDSGHLEEWTDFFLAAKEPVSLDIIVPEDGIHPLPVDRSRLQ